MRIHTLDLEHLGHRGRIASYLIEGAARPLLVEAGPSSCLGTLVARLAEHGVSPADVGHVFLTHIHLDHAGAAGWWAEQGATLHVHPKGARHLIDPGRLVASATRLYGRLMDTLWGGVPPAPAEQVHPVEDRELVDVGGLEVEAIATPGHAGHHHVYRIGSSAFLGDLGAILIPGTELVELPTPPPEFDPRLWTASLDRIAKLGLETVFATHFGAVDDVEAHLAHVGVLVERAVEAVEASLESGADRRQVHADFEAWRRSEHEARGAGAEQLGKLDSFNPPALSCAGILRYFEKVRGLVPRPGR